MEITVLSAGLSTSIQDGGRKGYAACGVPESGVMDRYAAGMANMLIGNNETVAVLEMVRLGPKLLFNGSHRLVLSGLKIEAYLNEEKIAGNKPFWVEKEDILEVRRIVGGSYAYLSINDGFQMPEVLSSQSFYAGITQKGRLAKGDKLKAKSIEKDSSKNYSKIRFKKRRYQKKKIAVLKGPEWHLLSEKQKKDILQQSFTLTADSNRMACLFKEKIAKHQHSMLTSPVLPGTIQFTSDGHLIVLMRDAQVTGGYPRVLQIVERDLNVLAQKRPGEKIRFSFLRE